MDYKLPENKGFKMNCPSANEFVGTIIHELRTPLQAIMASVDALKMDPSNTVKKNRSLERLEQSANILSRHVDDLRDYLLSDSNEFSIIEAEVDATAILKEVAIDFEHLAAEKDILLKFNFDNPFITAVLDGFRFRQIANNLVSNAIKYSDHGEVNLSLKLVNLAEDSKTEIPALTLSVSDTGRGIPKENSELVFDPFFRMYPKDISIKGMGLGLAITKRLCVRMGGKVEVISNEGKGSEFKVELPVKLV